MHIVVECYTAKVDTPLKSLYEANRSLNLYDVTCLRQINPLIIERRLHSSKSISNFATGGVCMTDRVIDDPSEMYLRYLFRLGICLVALK